MKYNDIIANVSQELKLPEELVDSTYKAYWNFIKSTIEELPLKNNISKEHFDTLNTSINIPSLGKFSCTYTKYIGLKNRFNIIKKLREKQ